MSRDFIDRRHVNAIQIPSPAGIVEDPERAGRAEEAERAILPLARSWFEWERDPAAYERARARLAAMIVAAGAAE